MAKRYDPIMCMMVDEPTKAQDELKIKKEDGLWCVYKDGKVVGQSNSEAGAIRIYNRLESGKDSVSTLDKAIKMCDASTGHKVVVFVENYLRSIGKNNSTGKYDKIVHGVRSLLSQSLLDDEGLKKAAEHEADRLLKKYNL